MLLFTYTFLHTELMLCPMLFKFPLHWNSCSTLHYRMFACTCIYIFSRTQPIERSQRTERTRRTRQTQRTRRTRPAPKPMPRRLALKPMPRQTTPSKAYVDPIPPTGMELPRHHGLLHDDNEFEVGMDSNGGDFTLSWLQGPMANDDCSLWSQYLRRTATYLVACFQLTNDMVRNQ